MSIYRTKGSGKKPTKELLNHHEILTQLEASSAWNHQHSCSVARPPLNTQTIVPKNAPYMVPRHAFGLDTHCTKDSANPTKQFFIHGKLQNMISSKIFCGANGSSLKILLFLQDQIFHKTKHHMMFHITLILMEPLWTGML